MKNKILMILEEKNIDNTLILINSIIKNDLISEYIIFFVGKEESITFYDKLMNFLYNYHIEFEYICNSNLNFRDYKYEVFHSIYLLPQSVNRIVYLDCFTFIKQRIDYLWQLDMQGKCFAACEDRWISKGVEPKELLAVGIDEKGVYYNISVLVLNLKEIRDKFPQDKLEELLHQNSELGEYRAKSFFNIYLSQECYEILQKKYNAQIMSYRVWMKDEKYKEAIIVNYEDTDMMGTDNDVYPSMYEEWLQYATEIKAIRTKSKKINLNIKKKLRDDLGLIRYIWNKLRNDKVNFSILEFREFLVKSGLWQCLYFFNVRKFAYEKKFRQMVKGYDGIKVHKLVGEAAGEFFLSIICYKILCKDNSFHIFIPSTQLYGTIIDRKDFFVHNAYILRYMENAFIPLKDDLEFLKYILSSKFYKIDFSQFTFFSPFAYEIQGGDYHEIEEMPLITFTEEENLRGEKFRKENNLLGDYVCIIPRFSSYKKEYIRTVGVNDYLSHRNGPIESFSLAVEHLLKNGIKLIQMGKVNEKSFPDKYRILDFSKVYDEFLDIYLYSKSKFVLGDNSGTMMLPVFFKKPTIQTNWEIITSNKEIYGYYKYDHDVILPIKYRDKKNGRYLTLKEQLELETKWKEVRFEEKIIESGYVPCNNTPEEILAAVKEMQEHILGKQEYSSEESELRNKSRTLIEKIAKKEKMSYPRCYIAVAFLKLNKWYLE